MTPQQYVAQNLFNLLMGNNPQLDPVATQTYANSVAELYTHLILPNLQVDLTTGSVTFVVPAGS